MDHKGKVRTPRQKRGIKTRDRIIEAAARLYGQKGFHGTNSKEIAAAAGVSVGTFYSYFQDKKDLFLKVLERHRDQVREIIASKGAVSPKGREPREFVHEMIKAILAAHEFSPEFHREATAMEYLDPDVRAQSDKSGEIGRKRLISLFESLRQGLRIKDFEAAAFVVSASCEAIIHSIKMFEPKIEQERLLEQLADMISRYLYKDPDTP